jgi:hypothetical protein
MFMHAIVDMEVVYGAEASGGQYRSRSLEGEYGAPIQTMVIIVRVAITENRFVYQIEYSIKRSN